jgi:hypothetical protein
LALLASEGVVHEAVVALDRGGVRAYHHRVGKGPQAVEEVAVLELDDGTAIALADVRVVTTPPPPAKKRDRRDRRLAACAHAFGYRGHCLTKSRGYSIRFKDLREDRERHVHAQLLARGTDATQRELAQLAPEQRITAFEFMGVGHLTTADAYLAAQAAARAREHRVLAREALYDHHNRSGEDRCEATQDQTRAA